MDETGAAYAYAYDSSDGLMRALGARGYPSAALVDPSGAVVWTGHPAALESSIVAAHLEGAFPRPIWEWPKSTKSVAKALGKRQFAKALAALEKLQGSDDTIPVIQSGVEAMVASRMAMLEKLFAEGDFLTALECAERARVELKGLEEPYDRASELVKHIKKDKEAKRVMGFQEDLLELKEERLNTRKDVNEMIELVLELRDEAVGTYAAKQAEEYAAQLREMLG